MKNLIIFSFFCFITICIFSCKKNSQQPAAPGIVGNWKLVTDSGYVDGGNVAPQPTTYRGQASDYYNFQSGGKLSWHENNVGSDSATYSLPTGSTIAISYLPKSNPNYTGVTPAYTITTLTANKLVLTLTDSPEVEDILTFSR